MQLGADGVSLQIRVVRLFEQLCQALGYMHDLGWVHRDVKPDNILFNKASELRLIDFSLSTKAAGAMSKLIGGKEKVIQGTRTYISPETILKAPPSPQSDIYSLGVTLFEVLTGEPPFRGTSPDDLLKKHLTTAAPPPSAINENVTPEMDRFVLKMLAKRPKDRYKNTHELLAEFRNIKPYKEDAAERDRRMKHEQEERVQAHARQVGPPRQPGRPSQATTVARESRFGPRGGGKEKETGSGRSREEKGACRQAREEGGQGKGRGRGRRPGLTTESRCSHRCSGAHARPATGPADARLPAGIWLSGTDAAWLSGCRLSAGLSADAGGYPQPGGYPPCARVPSMPGYHGGGQCRPVIPKVVIRSPRCRCSRNRCSVPSSSTLRGSRRHPVIHPEFLASRRERRPLEIKYGPPRRSPQLHRQQGVPLPLKRD